VPCYLEGTVPAVLSVGGGEHDPASPWWRMRELLTLVERDVTRFAPRVRAAFDAFEAEVARDAAAVETRAEAAARGGDGAAASALLTDLMTRAVDGWLARAGALVRELGAET
jgi:dipeptidase